MYIYTFIFELRLSHCSFQQVCHVLDIMSAEIISFCFIQHKHYSKKKFLLKSVIITLNVQGQRATTTITFLDIGIHCIFFSLKTLSGRSKTIGH